jgi:hypothetical protein
VKTITNKTHKPIKVPLPGGKFLYLGPMKTGQIADLSSERPAVKKLVEAGDVEIQSEETHQQQGSGKAAPGQAASHGHSPTGVLRPKGDR